MSAEDAIFPQLQEARRQFLSLIDEVRPDLHRYCARMTGSVADGEDVVQDTLARGYYELSQLREMPALRPWLFRIAHNRALDFLRSYERRMAEPLDDSFDAPADEAAGPGEALVREQAVRAAVSRFLELAPAQRSCVILKDVLEYSLEDIAALLGLTVPAVKAALHRGRARLHELSEAPQAAPAPGPVSEAALRYAALFNARDWDGVRAMLLDDVKLDLVSRTKRWGRRQVAEYFSNYDKARDWHLVPGWLDGREVLAVFRDPGAHLPGSRPGYFIALTLAGGGVAAIRDFRYVPYVARDAAFVRAG
jgi:RNA polymerase sigma factor (sigma-70 family)